MSDVTDDMLGMDPPQIPPPPPPPSMSQTKTPDLAVAQDRVRRQREQADAMAKRRGRASTVVTGPEGVGATPVGMKTLVGS
jgi:hypothetical protein